MGRKNLLSELERIKEEISGVYGQNKNVKTYLGEVYAGEIVSDTVINSKTFFMRTRQTADGEIHQIAFDEVEKVLPYDPDKSTFPKEIFGIGGRVSSFDLHSVSKNFKKRKNSYRE